MRSLAALALTAIFLAPLAAETPWPEPKSPAVASADGYVAIPGAAVPPDKTRVYRAVFDATRAADKPNVLLPALNMAGSELNAFAVAGVPNSHLKLAVVFHGAALDGILDEAHYKAKFGVSNPNLPVLRQFRKAGVELLVCGQNLAFEHIDPRTLSTEVKVASDALIVLITLQNRGYAVLSF